MCAHCNLFLELKMLARRSRRSRSPAPLCSGYRRCEYEFHVAFWLLGMHCADYIVLILHRLNPSFHGSVISPLIQCCFRTNADAEANCSDTFVRACVRMRRPRKSVYARGLSRARAGRSLGGTSARVRMWVNGFVRAHVRAVVIPGSDG